MEKPARIRATMPGYVLIDMDVRTLVLHMLLSDRSAALLTGDAGRLASWKSITYPIVIETTAGEWTYRETIEEDTEEID